jgi:hypothetical protein
VDKGWAGFGGTAAWTIESSALRDSDMDEQRRMAFIYSMKILGCIARYTKKVGRNDIQNIGSFALYS